MKQSDDFVEGESGWALDHDAGAWTSEPKKITIHGVVTVRPCTCNCGEEE